MGELWFVGAGLGDDQDLSRRALSQLKNCDIVFAETYTAILAEGSVARLSKEIGRPIRLLGRLEVEGEQVLLEALVSKPRVALLVVGDPFAATTHVALRLAAERAGHSWRYLPNASILTAAASFLGLIHYRFGRTVSLPFQTPGFNPRSPLEIMGQNRSQNLHTLVLLDLCPDAGSFLTADTALKQIGSSDPEGVVLPPDARFAVVARVGSPSAQGWVGTRSSLQGLDFGPPLHALVLLAAELHFEEVAALKRYELPDGVGSS
ncbi:MAG: diphthine synthase [Thermoplasmata archaeon]